MHSLTTARRGFTLIELSIVLVIIALIVGSVLVGRTLVNAAALRSQISQIEKYQTAANTFREKYGYLPGDIKAPDATRFGFIARGNSAGQGDGNGTILGYLPGCCSNGFTLIGGESPVFWVDLSTAHLIDGTFNTATMTTAPATVTETTSPNLKAFLPEAAIGLGNYLYIYSGGTYCSPNCIGLAAVTKLADDNTPGISGPGITVAQAYSIDQKIDDGLPTTGNVIAEYVDPDAFGGRTTPSHGAASSTTCYDTSATPNPYSIKVTTNTGRNCAIAFRFK
jgi:prepilin-type N-terminal cleavage/methylation domain-containing protein